MTLPRAAILQRGGIVFADTSNVDAFSRIRVSEPTNLFSVQSQYDAEPLQMESGSTGSGVAPAHSSDTRMVAVSCAAGTGTSFLQSYEYIPYRPGRSQLVEITCVLGASVGGTTTEVGLFDASNGVFLRQRSDGVLSFVTRSSTSGAVVDEEILQSNWNIDPLQGLGEFDLHVSGSTSMIVVFDFQYLGMGRVRVGFDLDGIIVYVHEFLNANNLSVPFMQTASLPIQFLVTASGSSSTKTAHFKSAAVHSEGGIDDEDGFHFSTPKASVVAAQATRTHLLSIRPKETFNSLVNRSLLTIDDISVWVKDGNSAFFEVVLGAEFSVQPTWSDVDASYSAFEYAVDGTYSSLGGPVVFSGFAGPLSPTRNKIPRMVSRKFPISLDRAGAVRANGTLSVLVSGIGLAVATQGSINFVEAR